MLNPPTLYSDPSTQHEYSEYYLSTTKVSSCCILDSNVSCQDKLIPGMSKLHPIINNLVQPPPRTSRKYHITVPILHCAGASRSMSHSNNPHHHLQRLSCKRFKAGVFAPNASDNWMSSTSSDEEASRRFPTVPLLLIYERRRAAAQMQGLAARMVLELNCRWLVGRARQPPMPCKGLLGTCICMYIHTYL